MSKSTKITSIDQLQRELDAGNEALANARKLLRQALGEPKRYRQTHLQRYEHFTLRFDKLRRSSFQRFEHIPLPPPPPTPHTPLEDLKGKLADPHLWADKLGEVIAILPPLRASGSAPFYDATPSSVPDVQASIQAAENILTTWREGMAHGLNYPYTGTYINSGGWRGMAKMATYTQALWIVLIDAIDVVHNKHVGNTSASTDAITLEIEVTYWGVMGELLSDAYDNYHADMLEAELEEEPDYDDYVDPNADKPARTSGQNFTPMEEEEADRAITILKNIGTSYQENRAKNKD